MNYIKALAKSLEYIDSNIKENITPTQICNVVGYSVFHFSRIFALCTGMPMMEYIRKRKLSLAVSQILNGGKVVDVAMEYGFSTHSGFTRAFEKQFGVSPKKYLTITQDKMYNNLLCNYGGAFMKPVIVEKPAFKVAGIGLNTHTSINGHTKDNGAFWDIIYGGPDIRAYMHNALISNETGEIGIFTKSYCINGIDFSCCDTPLYVLGIIVNDFSKASNFVTVEIAAATYAKFMLPPIDKNNINKSSENAFSKSIREGWKYISEIWLPESGYSFDEDKFDFEVYNDMARQNKTASMEFYVPIKQEK